MNSAIKAQKDAAADASGQRQLLDRLQRLATVLRNQCRRGWDINVMQRLHTEMGKLAASCNRFGQTAIAEQLLALQTTLGPALTRTRTPDSGSTAVVAALCDHMCTLVAALQEPQLTAPSEVPVQPGSDDEREIRVLSAGAIAHNAARLGNAIKGTPGFVARHISEPLAVLKELSRFAPDVVLLDLHLTVCGSQELASMIREQADFADIPILYVAADESAVSAITDVLPVSLPKADLLARLRKEVGTPDAGASEPAQGPTQRGQYRRAWLLDRLQAAINSNAGVKGGLLDVGMDQTEDLIGSNSRLVLQQMHQQLGALIGESMEGGDMLAENGSGRYLLLCRERSSEGMYALAEELHGRIARERFGPAASPVPVSIGGCVLSNKMDLADTVVAGAQSAREAAVPGRIGWHHLREHGIDALQLEHALRTKGLHLVYQAIVRLDGSLLPRYQALLRMRSQDGFVHTAAELLPVAEQSGLITMLDRWSLEQCLVLLDEHQRQTRPLHLFVSQSNDSLQERDYPAWLAERLNLRGVRGNRLVLDFRCQDISRAPQALMQAASRIKALGVGLCLSGVDRSMEAAKLLDLLPLDYIKLTPGLNTHPGALVPIAHARGIAVIATQVEDPVLLRKLQDAGVDSAQGHSLAHPARALGYNGFEAAAVG